MDSFRHQTWAHRYKLMGDVSEAAFERTAELPFARYGLERPPFSVGALPTFLANSPDYLQKERFVECQGCGKDGVIKMKIDKFNDLGLWNAIHPVWFFFYDSHRKKYTLVKYSHKLVKGATRAFFPEGKEYYELGKELFEWTDET